jgi:hypothetical protein
MSRLLLVLVVGGTACAQAHNETLGGRPDSGITVHDSNGGGGGDSNGTVDAPMQQIDAPQGGSTQTLSQTTAATDTLVGLACGNYTAGYTSRNSYYRVFPLANYGISGTWHVTGVDFIVSAAAGSPSLTVSIGTYNGTTGGQTINAAGVTLVQSTTYTPPSTQTATPAHVAITGDVTGNLVVEIDQKTAGSASNVLQFYPGANEAGESAPSYIMTPDCSINVPTSMDYEAQQQATPRHSNLVLTVTGSN